MSNVFWIIFSDGLHRAGLGAEHTVDAKLVGFHLKWEKMHRLFFVGIAAWNIQRIHVIEVDGRKPFSDGVPERVDDFYVFFIRPLEGQVAQKGVLTDERSGGHRQESSLGQQNFQLHQGVVDGPVAVGGHENSGCAVAAKVGETLADRRRNTPSVGGNAEDEKVCLTQGQRLLPDIIIGQIDLLDRIILEGRPDFRYHLFGCVGRAKTGTIYFCNFHNTFLLVMPVVSEHAVESSDNSCQVKNKKDCCPYYKSQEIQIQRDSSILYCRNQKKKL